MMLRIHTSTSVQQAENYYIKAASKEAYYSEGQEFTGFWGGKAAKMLGLSGRVDELAFTRLCNNEHPFTGEQLTPRMKSDRRPGYDFNFNCPKSVSLAYAWTKDERILRAFRQAVKDTMEDIERLAATRVRTNGRDEDRQTGNLVWGEFIHLTARPENGIPDPHLHAHCYVINTTFDKAENRWKAAQMGEIHDEADAFNGMVTLRLAANLKALGLEIETSAKSFEIAGISRELIESFSKRTQAINAEAIRRGVTDPDEKAKLGALTRENKSKTLLISELEPIWWGNLSPEDARALNAVKASLERSRAAEMSRELVGELDKGVPEAFASSDVLGTRKQSAAAESMKAAKARRVSLNRATAPVDSIPKAVEPTEHDRRAVALAMEHIFERQSVVTETKLLGEAAKSWCNGKATVEGIRRVIAETPLLRIERDGKTFVTTHEVLAEEHHLANRCISGIGQLEPVNPYWQIQDEALNHEQKEAVVHVLNSRDFVTGISGKPGVGKTRLLREIKQGIEAGGQKILALAPWAATAHEVLRKDGFENAETVAKLLESEALQKAAHGSVILVDEAGLLSTRLADRLLDVAAKLEARVVLVGDVGQHHAVERGQAFDLLQKSGRMSVVEVNEIQRQRGAYKRFVEQVVKHDWEQAFMSLDNMDAVIETTLEKRQKLLAADYVAAIEKGKSALVVAPTHVECENVTEGIRKALKEKHALKGSADWKILRNLSWTDAEKRDAAHYEPGMVVQINRHIRDFSLGEQLEVIGERDGMVRVRSRGALQDKIKALPLSQPKSFAVYQRDAIEVCEGERIRITSSGRNADGHRLNNGTLYTVDYIAHDGALVLENGWRLDKDFAHLDYGYATTSHTAQGKTVDWVFIAQSAQLSSGASDAKQFLVSTSRGREGLRIYTDCIELLRENVSRVRERPMATELLESVRTEPRQVEKSSAQSRHRKSTKRTAAELGHHVAAMHPTIEILGASIKRAPEPQSAEMPLADDRSATLLGTQPEMANTAYWAAKQKAAELPEREPELELEIE
jgi:conjugative relaxase-like TrwC/TraI family protein